MFLSKSRSIFSEHALCPWREPSIILPSLRHLLGSTHVRYVAGSVVGGVFLPISFTNQNATVITSSGKFSSGETRRQVGTVSATFYARSEVPPNQPLAGGGP